MALFDKKKSVDLCPECHSPLMIRKGEFGAFKGCSSYPACSFIEPFNLISTEQIRIIEEKNCPDCLANLALWKGRFGFFIACEHFPVCEYKIEKDPQEKTNIFCPICQKGMLKKHYSKRGKLFYSCDFYPKCNYLIYFEPISVCCLVCRFPIGMLQKNKLICANTNCVEKLEIVHEHC